jgi:hypothetical protein
VKDITPQSVESLCKSFSIEIDLCGAMKNDDGRAFLASSCDLGIAMGTAALDLAGAGLPTIIINPSIRFPTKQPSLYRFVNEIMDFTLGEFIDSPFFDRGGLPLDQIIKLINDQSDIAEKGLNTCRVCINRRKFI